MERDAGSWRRRGRNSILEMPPGGTGGPSRWRVEDVTRTNESPPLPSTVGPPDSSESPPGRGQRHAASGARATLAEGKRRLEDLVDDDGLAELRRRVQE